MFPSTTIPKKLDRSLALLKKNTFCFVTYKNLERQRVTIIPHCANFWKYLNAYSNLTALDTFAMVYAFLFYDTTIFLPFILMVFTPLFFFFPPRFSAMFFLLFIQSFIPYRSAETCCKGEA